MARRCAAVLGVEGGATTIVMIGPTCIASFAQTHANGIELQFHSGEAGFLGFGEAGVVDKGIKLSSATPYYQIAEGDPRLLQDIHMITASGTQSGGYQVR